MAAAAIPIAAAGVSAAGGLLSSIINNMADRRTNKTNLQIARENNEMAYKMFKEGNQFNHDEAKLAFDRNYEASKYTTQAQNMLDAGLNPAMMFGEGNTLSPAQSSAATAEGVPSLSTPTMISPHFDLRSIGEIANAFKTLADARKSGAETKSIESMLDEQVQDLKLKNEYQEIINTYQGKKSAAEVGKMLQDIEKQYVEIDNLIKEGNLTEAQTRLTNVNEQIAQENKGLAQADRELREALSARREEYTQNILDKQKEDIETTKKQGNMYVSQGQAALKSAAAALMQGQAALSNADVNRLNGESQRELWSKEGLKVDALRQLTDAQKMELCQKIAGALVTSGGEVHVDGVKQEWMQNALQRELYNQIRQEGADYWNPFKYVGSVFGVTKAIK